MENINLHEIAFKVSAFDEGKTYLANAIHNLLALKALLNENWPKQFFCPFRGNSSNDLNFHLLKETDLDAYIRNLERQMWLHAFTQSPVYEMCSEQKRKTIRENIDAGTMKPFTFENIQAFLEELTANKGPIMCEMVKETYRKIQGWKLTEAKMPVARKAVINSSSWNSLTFNPENRIWEFLGKSFLLLDNKELPTEYEHELQCRLQKCHQQRETSYEDEYFSMKFYEKSGTVHVTFKRLDLLRKFNDIALAA